MCGFDPILLLMNQTINQRWSITAKFNGTLNVDYYRQTHYMFTFSDSISLNTLKKIH